MGGTKTESSELKTSKLAEYAVVFGILGFLLQCAWFVPFLLCFIGLTLGIIALIKIKRNPETLKGKGIAISGLILSTAGIVLACFATYFHWKIIHR